MADDESPLFRDILISAALMDDINDDSSHHFDIIDTEIQNNSEGMMPSFDLFSWNYIREEDIAESISTDPFLSNSCSDASPETPSISSIQSPTPEIFTSCSQDNIVSSYPSCLIDINCLHHLSLSFINPPEPLYHVRYLSEITNSPVDGNIVNTKKKTKKNVSGRYLKGTHGRHVTIDIPINLSDYSDYFIRVTRLTVPYQNISFIHPYPLLYSTPKKKNDSNVIMKSSSIYYKLNKEEILSRSKQFPNIILTRLKQCQLKYLTTLDLFHDSSIKYPFLGDSPKHKIANYQLKKSELDFRLVIKCKQTGEFIDLNASCRSNPLLEEEGTECKKLSISSPL